MRRVAPPRVALVAVVALVMVAAAAWLQGRFGAKQGEAFIAIASDAYVLAAPEPIPPFRLLTHDNEPFDNAALKGNWSFVFFGFTHCPDFCPTTLAVFDELHRELGDRHAGADHVRFIMVSIDPERDTPELMKQYVPAFNREFLGLTGDAAGISRLSASLGVVYTKVPDASGTSYHMDHSSSVLLVDPEGRFHGVFAAPHVARNMARAFVEIRKRAQSPD